MIREGKKKMLFAFFTACIGIFLYLPLQAGAGQLEPPPEAVDANGNPVPTMKPLNETPPTWSRIMQASERFVLVMNGEAVLDRETGLVWEREVDPTERNWFDAVKHCYQRVVAGRRGWRLPKIEELASLFIPLGCNGNDDIICLPSGHPFTITLLPSPPSLEWVHSMTTAEAESSFSPLLEDWSSKQNWVLDLDSGFPNVFGGFDKSVGAQAWCVRGGTGYNAFSGY